MHNAPFYQTGCENYARDIIIPFIILEDFFSFRKSDQRKEAKERRNFGQLFIIVILFNWDCFPNRKTLKKMFNVFKLNKSNQFIFTLPFKSPETLKILEGDICKFSYGSNP